MGRSQKLEPSRAWAYDLGVFSPHGDRQAPKGVRSAGNKQILTHGSIFVNKRYLRHVWNFEASDCSALAGHPHTRRSAEPAGPEEIRGIETSP